MTSNCNIKVEKADVYCGRGNLGEVPWSVGERGWLGNPSIINCKCFVCGEVHKDGGSTLPCYEQYLKNRLEVDVQFKDAFYKLKDKKLGCFCKPKPCHTDVMIKYLDKE